MRKRIAYLAFAAALAFCYSCSNDEIVAVNDTPQDNEISFRTLVDGATRSTAGPMVGGTNFAVGDVINVYADFYDASATSHSTYFQADFTKQSSGGFTSANKYYWPSFDTGDKMTFTAIYGGTQVVGTPGKVTAFTPAAAAASQMDLMVARKEVTAKESPVALNFRHALSQIVVQVKNSNANLDFDITGVRIGYVSTEGEFNYDYNYSTSAADIGGVTTTQEATGDATGGNLTDGVSLVKYTNWNQVAVSDANTNKYDQDEWSAQTLTSSQNATELTSFNSWLLIPQTRSKATAYSVATQGNASDNPTLNGSYIALKLAIYNYNGTRGNQLVTEQWCYWPCDFTWNPGYKYTYTVDLAGGGYQPINTTAASTVLKPVLGDDEIIFDPNCTIDYWVVGTGGDVTM